MKTFSKEAARAAWAWTHVVVLPVAGALALATIAVWAIGPGQAPALPSGETWWRPWTWGLDEAASLAQASSQAALVATWEMTVWAMAAMTVAATVAAVMVLARAVTPEARPRLAFGRSEWIKVNEWREVRSARVALCDLQDAAARALALVGPIEEAARQEELSAAQAADKARQGLAKASAPAKAPAKAGTMEEILPSGQMAGFQDEEELLQTGGSSR